MPHLSGCPFAPLVLLVLCMPVLHAICLLADMADERVNVYGLYLVGKAGRGQKVGRELGQLFWDPPENRALVFLG